MPAVSREEGYRASVGKEMPAVHLCAELLRDELGVPTTEINDPERNRLAGDLAAPKRTIEVKGQPIDPAQYRMNFIEVMEDTSRLQRAHHRGGFARTAEILGISVDQLARASVGKDKKPLGHLPFASASLESMSRAAFVMYANAAAGWVYLYGARRLRGQIKDAIRIEGFTRGLGRSNDDTLAVFVPNAEVRWKLERGAWVYHGDLLSLAEVRCLARRKLL